MAKSSATAGLRRTSIGLPRNTALQRSSTRRFTRARVTMSRYSAATPSASTMTMPAVADPEIHNPGAARPAAPGYVDHTVPGPSLVDQLEAKGLTWKAYMESIPTPGSGAVRWPTAAHPVNGTPAELYAVKHNGFMNFKRVQDDPRRAAKIVGFDVLEHNLKS